MKKVQLPNTRLLATATGERIPHLVRTPEGKMFCVRKTNMNAKQGHYGKAYLEELDVKPNQKLENVLDVEHGEQLSLIYTQNSRFKIMKFNVK